METKDYSIKSTIVKLMPLVTVILVNGISLPVNTVNQQDTVKEIKHLSSNSDLNYYNLNNYLPCGRTLEKEDKKMKNLERIEDIKKLQDNWDGYGSNVFSDRVIERCRNIVLGLEKQPQIFPTGRNSIQMQFELESTSYLEFEVFEEAVKYLLVPYREYTSAVSKDISEDKINDMVKVFYEKYC